MSRNGIRKVAITNNFFLPDEIGAAVPEFLAIDCVTHVIISGLFFHSNVWKNSESA
jgi:hypothetical protein